MSSKPAELGWFRLDNAATIYPHARTRNWNSVFRVAIVLKEDVDPAVLKRAVEDLMPRFPSMFVTVRAGAFWYYLESCRNPNVLARERLFPCTNVDMFNGKKPAFRIVYCKGRIAYEGFHSLTDGTGGFEFLKCLVVRYLALKGYDVENGESIKAFDDDPKPSELEDSFKRHYSSDCEKVKRSTRSAYKYIPDNREIGLTRVIHGLVPIDDLKAVTKKLGVTVTDYLLGLYLYSLYKDFRDRFGDVEMKKPITVSVPINLRQLFESDTMRNFALFANIGFLPEKGRDYTFEDVTSEIAGKLKEALAKDKMLSTFSKNVSDASNPLMRVVPLPLKRLALRTAFSIVGERLVTTNMTNIGIVKFPDSVACHVERCECLLRLSPFSDINCAIVSYKGIINISFTEDSMSSSVQRHFFRTMTEQGINVRIESNIQ